MLWGLMRRAFYLVLKGSRHSIFKSPFDYGLRFHKSFPKRIWILTPLNPEIFKGRRHNVHPFWWRSNRLGQIGLKVLWNTAQSVLMYIIGVIKKKLIICEMRVSWLDFGYGVEDRLSWINSPVWFHFAFLHSKGLDLMLQPPNEYNWD